MPDKKLVGGYEHALIYKVKSDWTAVVQDDGTTTATSNAHAVLDITTALLKTTLTGDKLTLETVKNDDAVNAFLMANVDFDASDVSPETVYGQAGTKHTTSSSSTATTFLVVVAGAANADGVKALAFTGSLDVESVNETWENEKFDRITLSFTAVNAEVALSIANGLLPTSVYDSGETITVALNKPMWKGMLAAA